MKVQGSVMSTVFSDEFVRTLADKGNQRQGRLMIPPGFDIDRLGSGLRSAERERIEMKSAPTHADMRREIVRLHGLSMTALAQKSVKAFEAVAQALSDLSTETHAYLSKYRLHVLPEATALRNPTKREDACKAVVGLCVLRRTFDDDGTMHIEFNAPPQKRKKKREADRLFVSLIQEAWISAGGAPAWNADHVKPGPLAKMVAACLQAVGAVGDKLNQHAESVAVALINQLEKERRGTISAEFVRIEQGIVNALKGGPKERSEIYRLFRPRLRRLRRPGGEVVSAGDFIQAALNDLKGSGYVTRQQRRTGGRSVEVWSLIPASRTAPRDSEIRRLPRIASATV